MSEKPALIDPNHVSRRTYVIIFVGLVLVTLAELGLASLDMHQTLQNTIFISMAFAKAAFVVGIYMHLRYDSRFYAFVFLAPAALIILFALLALLS